MKIYQYLKILKIEKGDMEPYLIAQGTIYPRGRMQSIMIKGINPATEFIIEGSTLPVYNRDRCYDSLPAKRASVLPLCGPGVVYSDVTKLWADILQRKRYEDMTGNNVNHPND